MADAGEFEFKIGCRIECVIAILAVFVAMSGCNANNKARDSKDKSTEAWQANDSLSADDIVAKMREAYLSASSYRDEAILGLSYRLQGRYLEEPHQWSVEFERPGQLRASVYNSRLRCDGQKMACFVFDFGSGNLGNQWQVHNVTGNLPFGRFFQDGICRHYLTGQTDLPVDRENPKVAEMFFPPTMGLLTGNVPVDWLERGRFVRKPDRTLDSRAFHVIDVTCDEMAYELVIDATSFLMSEIRYPVKALDGRLLTSPDVENLEIVAQFKGATTTTSFEPGHFALATPPEAVTVNHFVPVPEPFPSPMIAKSIAHLGLLDLRGEPINQADWKGKVTLLAWSSNGLLDESWSSVFSQLALELAVQEYHIATVNVVPARIPGDSSMDDAIRNLRPEKVMANYVDPGFEGGKVLGVDEWPFYAVIDRQGVLQYVYANQQDPPDVNDVRSILLRVRSGDDVALEMRTEYEKFLERYHERLAMALQKKGGTTGKNSELSNRQMPENFTLREIWKTDELIQPGNLLPIGPFGSRVMAVDGWRTIVTLGNDGKVDARHEILLPLRESINVVRKSVTSGNCVVFSKAGRHVHVVNGENQVIFRVLDSKGSERICDAALADLNGDGLDELYVSWTGERGTEVYRPESSESQFQIFRDSSWNDSCVVLDNNGPEKLVVCDQDGQLKLVMVDDRGKAVVTEVATALDSVVRVQSAIIHGSPSTVCVVGTDSRGDWKAVLIDSQIQQSAIVSVGPQHFVTQIGPIAFARKTESQSGLWGIAGSDGSVSFISENGLVIDRWNTGQVIDGIAMLGKERSQVIVLSSEHTVTAWELTGSDRN